MNPLKYYNYNRKSTDSEDKQILSLPAQEESAQEIALKFDLSIVAVINESRSAKIPGKREGFSRMITAIRKGHCNAILCWKLDRLARNMEEGGVLIELLQQGKIKEIRTPGKTYVPSENAILLAVEFGSANQYSRELSENIRRGLRKKATMGVPNGVAPFGFLNDKTGEKGTRRWKPDNERILILRAIFDKLLAGSVSTRHIYRWALETYHPTTIKRRRRGGKKLSESYFYTMLRDPVYAGFFEYEGIRYELDPSLPRAITEGQFYRVQRILNNGISSKIYRHDATYTRLIKSPAGEYVGPDFKYQLICDCKHKFSYANRTHCPKCSSPIAELVNPKYLSYTYYYNVSRKKKRESVKMLSEAHIEHELKSFLSSLQFSNEMKEWIKDFAERDNDNPEDQLERKRKSETLAELNKKRKRLRDLLADEIISREDYISDIKEIDDVQAQVAISMEKKGERYVESLGVILNAYDGFVLNTPEHKRSVLHRLGSNLIWDEKNLYIHWPKWVLAFKKGIVEAMSKNPRFEPDNSLADKDPTDVFASVSPILSRTLENVRNNFYNDT